MSNNTGLQRGALLNNGTNIDEYTKTFSSFSGADIVASFNGQVIGELQSITYSISREKSPIA